MENNQEEATVIDSRNKSLSNERKRPFQRHWWFWVIIIVVLAAAGLVGCRYVVRDDNSAKDTGQVTNATPVTIPEKVLNNKFGWLGGGAEDDGSTISENGGAWVRPHLGPFVWDMMQTKADGTIDFDDADATVRSYAKNNIAIMATLWPFAEWDQQNLISANSCQVAENDEFLPKNDKKRRGSYLPLHRCNPSSWTAYQAWVEKIVERYDGDGEDDMPGLSAPIKYWEVMNEPDLNYQSNLPAGESSSLNFYKQGPTEYATLLVSTFKAIKSADNDAKVLIAGAAGGDTRMLNFYREVFKNTEAKSSFDIGNVHCISNDQGSHDFNVGKYKAMLQSFGLSQSIWVTEAEAFYRENTTAEQNFQSTKTSSTNAIAAGAQRIFFTRYNFDDFRTDMSKTTTVNTYPSSEKYREITEDLSK